VTPTEPDAPNPVITGHPGGLPMKQPEPAPPAGGDAADTASGGMEVAGGVLEGVGCCLDGCAGCSIAVLVAIFSAGAAVAAWLG
jgi:hypothetical protein